MDEITTMIISAKLWVEKSMTGNTTWTVVPLTILSILLSIMFPSEIYIIAFFALVIVICIDTGTRIYAELKNKRKMIGVITSNKLWSGISGKLLVVMITSILLGLLNSIESLSLISLCLFNFIYAILFLREFYSVFENLHDAGHTQVDIFLKLIKLKENEILKDNKLDK